MEPMTMLAVGGMIAGGVSSILGGRAAGAQARAQAEQIRQQNRQAMRNWVAGNTQVSINNARQQFQSVYQFEQQARRNSAIAQAAYQYQSEAKDALASQSSFQQSELSKQLTSQKSSLLNALQTKGISSDSGTFGALATMQALNGLKNAVQLEKNRLMQANNIDKQTKNMLSQQTANIFMPNIQGYNEAPILGDVSGVLAAGRAAQTAGIVGGALQIGFGVAGGAMSLSGPSGGATQYSTGGSGSSSNVGNFSNTPQSAGSVSGNMGFA